MHAVSPFSLRLLLPVLLLLAGCADRERIDRLETLPEDRLVRSVLMASSRAPRGPEAALPEAPETAALPGRTRSQELSFGRFDVVIPAAHVAGRMEMPTRGGRFNPERHFALAASQMMDAPAFRATLARELAARPRNQREAVIFVHGFNTSFMEGVYRVAQLGHDLNLPGLVLHYSWPSLGAPLAYAHDRDSALFARDGLEAMLRETLAAGAPGVVLVGHSMGAHLVMETLRQIALQGDRRLLDRLSGVVLIAPDIDVDLFNAQAGRIGRLPQPFLIITSQRDRILQLSAQLTGQRARLGNVPSAAPLGDLAVTVVDVSAFSTGSGHFTVGTSPALIQLLDQAGVIDAALSADQAGRLPFLPATILTIRNATQIILEPLTETVLGGS